MKLGGLALLLGIPMAGLGLQHAGGVLALRPLAIGAEEPPPVVSLSIELEPIPGSEPPLTTMPEEPVIVQTSGYVLPDLAGPRGGEDPDAGH